MENNNGKFEEYWEALDNSSRVEPEESFLQKLESLALNHPLKKYISMKRLVGIAASVILLISINLYVLNSTGSGPDNDRMHAEYEDEYSLIPNPFI